MMRRSIRREDEGVSVVVSAVLVFALIMMVLAVYLMTIVPDQVREAEASHMRGVNGAMGDLAHRLTQASALTEGGQFSQQIDLGATSVPFFAAAESSGRLSMSQNAFFSSLSCFKTWLVARDGAAAPGAQFAAATGSLVATDIMVVELRVSGYTFQSGFVHTATITASIPSAGTVGTLRLEIDGNSDTVVVETRDAADGVVARHVVLSGAGGTVDLLRINALDPIYGFASIIEDAQGERTIAFTTDVAQVTVYAVGRADDGTIVTKGSGRELPAGFERSVNSAALVYESRNNLFMDQSYAMEGGALVTSQAGGEFLSLAPFRLVGAGAGPGYMRLALISLTGTGDTSGTHAATASAVVRAPVASIIECEKPLIRVASTYQGAWRAAWGDALRRAGLEPEPPVFDEIGVFIEVELPEKWFVELTEARADLRLA